MSEHHPWVREFIAALDGQAHAGRDGRVLLRLVEAFADDRGLPTLTGLRRLESGALDDRLPAEWKPVYVDVYRRWIGHRLDREFSLGPRPLSLRWWLQPLARWRGRLPEAVRVLTTPVLPLLLLTVISAVLVVPLLVRARSEARDAAGALRDFVAADAELDRARQELAEHVGLADADEVEALAEAWPRYLAALSAAEREHARLEGAAAR